MEKMLELREKRDVTKNEKRNKRERKTEKERKREGEKEEDEAFYILL